MFLSQLRDVIGLLFLLSVSVGLLVDVSLVSGSTATCLVTEIDDLYHIFELDIICESF